ncbi:MAG: hypothetical protein OXE94_12030 [Aestuariivita sp.]|nr:hypothetical protein [Aestuariivita sp.]MCY4202346.1 hypothetical protein [Aestuariivita sp.]MCY4289509.1 hypothetical protein [Aestuariivita sp.]MCY4347287.1 hypothetical protein [Aestuariivita sp.]
MCEPYVLLREDVEYLDAHFPERWHKLSEGSGKHALLIEEFEIPNGFAQEKADLMILIPSGYPGVGLDMFYFNPSLQKPNNQEVEAIALEEHFNRSWQRWSRHYTWIPGEHNLYLHIEFVRNELETAGSK